MIARRRRFRAAVLLRAQPAGASAASCVLGRPLAAPRWLGILVLGVVLLGCVRPLQAQNEQAPAARTNRLARETSPYLLGHSTNPVDWRPWNEESLAAAKQENKVIFLSIGYSSCHWCHVMERESFLDEEIAAFLNKHFICIKVDREERPDIDSIYMTSLQVYNQLTGNGRGGGWPLSMFLTPDAEPFVGGTYFPARDGQRGVGTGFLTLIRRVHELWTSVPTQIVADAKTITRVVKTELEGRAAEPQATPGPEVAQAALDELSAEFDPKYGGFGFREDTPNVPKFPEASNLFFLIDQLDRLPIAERPKDPAWKMLQTTLDGMARGGVWDHVGGGFHRYSVNRYWRIPHFEKMLYDNGQLLSVYAEAYRLTGQESYRRICEGILAFLEREMTAPGGAFYAALDADSEHEEGKFYRWTRDEAQAALSAPQYALWADVYGVAEPPNFDGQWYAPQRRRSWKEEAQAQGMDQEALWSQLAPINARLLAVRSQRERPLTDTKILTAWNGMMIRGLADAARTLKHPGSLQMARQAAEFLWTRLRDDSGRLKRTFSQDAARLNAYLDDYAMFIDGLLALQQASGEPIWLERAQQLQEVQDDLFWDAAQGGYFFTSNDHESLLARAKKPVDAATPAGNSVAAGNLLTLAERTHRYEYRERAERTLQSAAELLRRRPAAAIRMVIAVRRFQAAP